MKVNYISTTSPKTVEVKNYSLSAEKTNSPSPELEKASTAVEDQVSISEQARDLHHTEVAVREELKKLPDLRSNLVRDLKNKLQESSYISAQLWENSAEKIVEHFSPSARRSEGDTAHDLKNHLDEIPDIRQAQVEKSQERAHLGYYNREEILKATANNLWTPQFNRK